MNNKELQELLIFCEQNNIDVMLERYGVTLKMRVRDWKYAHIFTWEVLESTNLPFVDLWKMFMTNAVAEFNKKEITNGS